MGGAKQQSPTTPTQSLDPAYSHLLTQQQVFLQLQILQSQQQQLTVVPRWANVTGDTSTDLCSINNLLVLRCVFAGVNRSVVPLVEIIMIL